MGIGQIYVGRVGRGIVILLIGLVVVPFIFISLFFTAMPLVALGGNPGAIVGTFFLVILFFIAIWLVLFIWQAFDAYSLANEYNRRAASGVAPW